jgi:phage recombination protein Bet
VSKLVAANQNTQVAELQPYTQAWVDLVKRQIAPESTDDELKLFLYQCQKTRLDPLARQIYFQKRAGKMTVLTGIDGYRLTADRTGLYAGSDDPVFDDEERPNKATVTVYKVVAGVRCPYTATARWSEYFPGEKQGFMWMKMPHLMLSKCAEALALRKAFPQELSGVYVKEEMDQAGEVLPVTATVVEAPVPAPTPTTRTRAAPKPSLYDNNNPAHQDLIAAKMKGKVDEGYWEAIGKALHGKPFDDLRTVADEVVAIPF